MREADTNIRHADLSDADVAREISAEAYVPAYEAVIGTVPKPAFEDYRPRISRGEVWLLESHEGSCGVVILEPKERYLLIYSIAVRPRFQGRGYGRRLLSFAERHATEICEREIRLYTNTRMEQNIRLYRNCGFQDIGTRPHPNRTGESLVDMSKVIES